MSYREYRFFLVTSEVICQWISRVSKSRMKIIGKSRHEWLKYRYSWQRIYHFISYTILYITLLTQHSAKQSSIAHFAIVTKGGVFWFSIVMSPQLICDVTWTQGTSIVTPYSSIVLARANWRKGDLHLGDNDREYRYLTIRYSRLNV